MKRKWLEGLSPAHVEALDRARQQFLRTIYPEYGIPRAVPRTLIVDGQAWETPRCWRLAVRKRARRLRRRARARYTLGVDFAHLDAAEVLMAINQVGTLSLEEVESSFHRTKCGRVFVDLSAGDFAPTLSMNSTRKKGR